MRSPSLISWVWAVASSVAIFVLFFGTTYVPGMTEPIEEYVAALLILSAFVIDQFTNVGRTDEPKPDE